MKISKMLLISIFITAAIVAVVGGVVTKVLADKAASADAAKIADNVSTDQAALAAYQQREAEYNQMIQQANQQLEKANSELKVMQQQISQTKAENSPSTAAGVTLSADQASEIAQKVVDAGQQIQKKPELVKYQERVAYEVVFEKGSVYVDGATGEVLFNGTVPQKITAEKAALVAADYLKDKDILSVDQIIFHNAPLYRVVFKSGMMVYLDLTGQITYIQKAVPDAKPVLAASSGGNSNNAPAVTSPPSHESEGSDD